MTGIREIARPVRSGRVHGPPARIVVRRVPSATVLIRRVLYGSEAAAAHYAVDDRGAIYRLADEGDRVVGEGHGEVVRVAVDAMTATDAIGSAAALVAEIATRWGMREAVEVEGPRDPGLDRLAAVVARPNGEPPEPASSRAVCLVPVRNGADDLPGLLASLRPTGAQVLALDDGSTDATGKLLEADPSVTTILRNPPRPTAGGWHDGANRNRLLAAAREREASWAFFIDADERFSPADAAALGVMFAAGLDPACAYGFRLSTRLDRGRSADRWVYRMFAVRPGTWLPTRRLHFDPIPVDIPRARYRRLGIRLEHLGRSTARRRRLAADAYEAADPGRRYGEWVGGWERGWAVP